MSRFTSTVERTRIFCLSLFFSFFGGNASEFYALPDYHDHIHSMVVQEFISDDMTCQYLTWLGSMGNVCVWTQYSLCFFMYMSHVIAGLVQQHFFGRPQPSVHCLIGNGELLKEKTGEQLAKQKVSPPKQASGTSMTMPGATHKETRSNLRAVRRILSQWKKVRRSRLRATIIIPSQ